MHVTDDYGNRLPSPRHAGIHDRLDALDGKIKDEEAMIAAIHADLATNTKATQEIAAQVAEAVAFFESLQGAFKTLEMLGKLARPLSYILGFGAAMLTFWAAIKSGTIGPR